MIIGQNIDEVRRVRKSQAPESGLPLVGFGTCCGWTKLVRTTKMSRFPCISTMVS